MLYEVANSPDHGEQKLTRHSRRVTEHLVVGCDAHYFQFTIKATRV